MLSEREQAILTLVIEDVVRTGAPVGSRYLVNKYGLTFSPATVRMIFSALEREGYLTHPHTSAGRVPTEKGYRLYLSALMRIRELQRREVERLRLAAQSLHRLAATLSAMTNAAFLLMERDRLLPFATGLSQLFDQPEFEDRSRMRALGTALDDIEDTFRSVDARVDREPVALIGSDCPFGHACGSVFMRVGDGTLISLFGPLRMDYARAVAALRRSQEFFDAYDGS